MKSDDLYKYASTGMIKKALDFNSIANTSLAGAVGALGGAGLGYLADSMTPRDEDEDKKKRLLTNVLTGAAMGGLAGVGGRALYKTLNLGAGNRPNFYVRNAPEIGYTPLAAIPAGISLYNLGSSTSTRTKNNRLFNYINELTQSQGGKDITDLLDNLKKTSKGFKVHSADVLKGHAPIIAAANNRAEAGSILNRLKFIAQGNKNSAVKESLLNRLGQVIRGKGGSFTTNILDKDKEIAKAVLDALPANAKQKVNAQVAEKLVPKIVNLSRSVNDKNAFSALRRSGKFALATIPALLAASVVDAYRRKEQ
jgi:hypothetical protein